MRHRHSEYMHWAKTLRGARYNLATSGVAPFSLRDLPFDFATLEINGLNSYGYRPLAEAIARRHGVDPDCVVEASGTAMATFLTMAALIEPGDDVLIEDPAYGPILDAALFLGAQAKRFPRRVENGFFVDTEEVRRAVTPKTRLIVITNLHNPSSVLTPDAVLREIGAIGPHVLVDEVYLDAVYENTPRSAFHLGTNFVTNSSLTKIYGLSGLRCGWILARPDLAERMRRLNDIIAPTLTYPTEVLSVAAFQNLGMIRDRARRIVETDRARLTQFLDSHSADLATRTAWGTTCLFKAPGGDADAFLARLRAGFETSAVPGKFFGLPGHFRVGMGQDSEVFAEGLRRIGQALATASAA